MSINSSGNDETSSWANLKAGLKTELNTGEKGVMNYFLLILLLGLQCIVLQLLFMVCMPSPHEVHH
jgi:hypothetical protein